MLILGPPRSGKTSLARHPHRPRRARRGGLDLDQARRAGGHGLPALGARARCFVFDPSGTVTLPEGAYPLRWSPVVGCDDFETAVAMAHALGSAARPGSALTESAHWVERAEGLLAPLLFAATLRGPDMATLCRWVLARDLREPLAALEASGHEMALCRHGRRGRDRGPRALGHLLDRRGAARRLSLRGRAGHDDGPRTSTRPPSPARPTPSTSAPRRHAQEQLAPIVVALLEQIRAAVYARPADAAPVVFALDEVAGIAPLPSLPALAAEGAGQGLVTLACLQDLSQARARWGDEAEGFFSLFNSKVIFPGIGDHRTLSLVSALAGEQVVPVRSRTSVHPLVALISPSGAPPPSTTRSITWRPRLPVDEVARGRPGQVLCLAGGGMSWFSVSHWQRHGYWSQLARMSVPEYSEITSVSPVDTDPLGGATYRQGDPYPGPRIVRASSDPGGVWVWVDNGTASVAERFAPPPTLVLFSNRALLSPWARAAMSWTSLAAPEGDHDPLFDGPEAQRDGGGEGTEACCSRAGALGGPEGRHGPGARPGRGHRLAPPTRAGRRDRAGLLPGPPSGPAGFG